MKWLLYGCLGLIAAVVAGLFVVPKLIDWNEYRSQIAHQIQAETGFSVDLKGPISATLLPTPRLILTQIEIRDPATTTPRATIRWIGADASLPALLQGRVRVTGISIVEPSILGAGFNIPDAGNITETAPVPDVSESNGFSATSYQLDGRVRVEKGSILWPNGERSSNIEGTITADGQAGRWSANLTAMHRDVPFDIGFRIVPGAASTDSRLQATIAPSNAEATMDVSGNLSLTEDAGMSFSGTVIAAIDEPSATLKPWWPQLAPVLVSSGAIRIETQAHVTSDTVDLQSIQFESPGGSGSGYVTLNFTDAGQADVHLQFNRLDLDALRRQPAPESGVPAVDQSTEGLESTISPQPDKAALSPLQTFGASGMDATFDISAAAVRLKGSLVRNAVIRGSIEDGAVTLEEIAALLPGGSSVSLAGYGAISPVTIFEGNVSVQADDLRRLMKWGGLRVPNVSADRLRSLDFVSGIKYAENRLDLIDSSVVVDGVEAEVSAAIALRQRPGIGLRVAIERLNLDAYRILNEQTVSSGVVSGENLGLEVPPQTATDELLHVAPAFDAIVDLTIQQLIVSGVPVKALAGRLEYRRGQLRSDALTFVDAGGLAGSVMGEFDVGSPGVPGSATVRGHGEDFGALAAILGASDTIATRVRQFGESDVTVVYERDAPIQRLGFQIDGANGTTAADTSWQTVGSAIEVSVADGVLKTGALDAHDISFVAVSQASGDIRFDDITGVVYDGTLSGELTASKARVGWTGQGHINVSEMPVYTLFDGLQGNVRSQGSLSIDTNVQFDESRSLSNQSSLIVEGQVSGTIGLSIPAESGAVVRVARMERIKEVLRRSFSATPQPVQGVIVASDRAVSTNGISITGSDGAQILLNGQADFSTQTVTAGVRVTSGVEPGYMLTISGPLNRPSLRLSN